MIETMKNSDYLMCPYHLAQQSCEMSLIRSQPEDSLNVTSFGGCSLKEY